MSAKRVTGGRTIGASAHRSVSEAWSYALGFLVRCLAIPLLCCNEIAFAASDTGSSVADELLVAPRPGVERARAERIYHSHGATIIDEIPQIGVHVLRVPAEALASVEQALSHRAEFEFVERNFILPPALTANDMYYPQEWHLQRISAPSAWDLTVGDPGVIVAILDSGIDPSHPDLAAKLVPGYNLYDNNTDTSDVYGHGTEVAGSVAAISNNVSGVTSVAWQSALMPIRVTDTGGSASTSTIAKGLTWAADHGARVMNISFNDVPRSSTIANAAQYVNGKGGVVVASAGNCGCADPTPENPYVISVSATTAKDALAAFSSRGPYVDLAAPGAGIITTERGGGYSSVSGTSFSSPVAAGVVALMMAANSALGADQVEMLLEETAIDLGDPGYDPSFGFGLVDAAAAVNAAVASSSPPADTTSPSASISAPAAGSVVSGITSVEITALDDRGVTRVEFYVDGALFATDAAAPFSFAWDTSTAASGSHALVAKAYDAAGNCGTSATVQVTLAATPPTVVITSPSTGSTVTKTVKIVLSATDDSKLTLLQAVVDGVSLGTSACSSTSCSTTFIWKSQGAGRGSHSISAVAYDANGNSGSATPVIVYVK